MQHSCHHQDTICHPNSSYVTTKLYRTCTRVCNNNTIFQKEIYVRISYRRRMILLAWLRSGLGYARQLETGGEGIICKTNTTVSVMASASSFHAIIG